jgi:CheY-like chemotaxis protein
MIGALIAAEGESLMTTAIILLLIDDDDVDREVVRRFLPPHYDIQEASLGIEALRLVQAHRPDCILLDWHLPDVDGLRLLEAFSKARIPVIVITGERNPQVIMQAMQRGAQDFLLKDELCRAVLEQAILDALADVAVQGKGVADAQVHISPSFLTSQVKNVSIYAHL